MTLMIDGQAQAMMVDIRAQSLPSAHGWTKRHVEIAGLVALGFTNKEIGARLYIEANTVKKHLHTMFERYGARSKAHLVFIAMRAGVFR